ncbi:hypothetical protein HU200_018568 [Digitaria exilis]|uniref:Uncharacterized protein n=1 Tax=Digitaria exilis TaxID=1010633 RepID=A0A835KIU1_9POAL|nr:hypothetical protein HU200_018568 [Digitaria exilis]
MVNVDVIGPASTPFRLRHDLSTHPTDAQARGGPHRDTRSNLKQERHVPATAPPRARHGLCNPIQGKLPPARSAASSATATRRRKLGARARGSRPQSPALDCSVPACDRLVSDGGTGEEAGRERHRRGGMGQVRRRWAWAGWGGGGAWRFYIFRRCVAMLVCWHKYKKI